MAVHPWCVSFQHEWAEYACPPITGLGMGWEGRCYNSSCVLLGEAVGTERHQHVHHRSGREIDDQTVGYRCDEQEQGLVTAATSPLMGKLYFVSPKVFK